MNKLPVYIGLIFMSPVIGMAGGMLLSAWSEGVYLQPIWVRGLAGFAMVVLCCRLIFQIFTSDGAFNITLNRIGPELMGFVMMPIFTGVLTGSMSEILMFGFPEQESGRGNLMTDAIAMQLYPYITLPFIIWSIYKELIHPACSILYRLKFRKK
ncbi:hypothetical protein Q3R63_004425 [Salmonella enterica]|nr:hypothetical protein [Salmonella enterica]